MYLLVLNCATIDLLFGPSFDLNLARRSEANY